MKKTEKKLTSADILREPPDPYYDRTSELRWFQCQISPIHEKERILAQKWVSMVKRNDANLPILPVKAQGHPDEVWVAVPVEEVPYSSGGRG